MTVVAVAMPVMATTKHDDRRAGRPNHPGGRDWSCRSRNVVRQGAAGRPGPALIPAVEWGPLRAALAARLALGILGLLFGVVGGSRCGLLFPAEGRGHCLVQLGSEHLHAEDLAIAADQ